MAHIFKKDSITFEINKSTIPEFVWHSSPRLSELVQSKHLHFDIKRLDPGKYSYPYHFHRNAEEIFVILKGKGMLRTNDSFEELVAGDIVFFEIGPTGAHQLYNHTLEICEYLDIRTEAGIDVCEYPDSGKVNILPYKEIYETNSRVEYFKGEDKVKDKWPDDGGL
ncbi:cupin domain-containing protein [Mobilitalea sibirica]|uniref:Cupin domain-containing protein n=1 Tax=Mobilitalea sibirica TaxID=1462919 RepID=A0A8J7H4S5_9FIRM|nr:cupin domain-containing protein [Mobilitalea sibirica]MBH1939646.1 cupin domain-containing protein [Mobilitalea sibirica]